MLYVNVDSTLRINVESTCFMLCDRWLVTIFIFIALLSFLSELYITKTCLFKYTENFITKKWKFSDKKNLIFFKFLLKT